MSPFHAITAASLLVSLTLAGTACERTATQNATKDTTAAPAASDLESLISRFAPTDITADTTKLAPADRQALAKIVQAAALYEPLFLRQVWLGNDSLLARLERDTSATGRARLHYFRINAGPWSRLDKRAFIDGVPAEQPPGAGFYPEDMTKEEFETWAKGLPAADREKAEGFFWVIRRNADRTLKIVPYSQEYREFLEPAAKLLKEAAALTPNASLKRFLTLRADAFLTDNYRPSDAAWMDLDAPIDLTMGPYETYEDGLLGYKASFEAYVTLRDDAETAKLQRFSGFLQDLENHLPIDPKYRTPKLGAAAPIRVVNELYATGDGNRGVQTAAFNLPNDEQVIREKGSKRVMLRNVQEAKFNANLVPIAGLVLDSADRKDVSFDAFFTHTVAHELMHGLGPHTITVAGRATNVRKELKDLYSAIEEAKADVTGLWALQYLMDKGSIDKSMERALYTTYLASMFRSVRFGLTEAHGKGVAMQFNYLLDKGAFSLNPDSTTFRADPVKFKDAITGITHDILTVEAEGDYAKAKQMLDTYGAVRPILQRTADRLKSVPVDIEPHYPGAQALGGKTR